MLSLSGYLEKSFGANYFILHSLKGLPWWLRRERICLQCGRPGFNSWVGKICWRKDRLPTPVFLGFLSGSAGKESACNAGDLGSIPGLGRSPGEGNVYPLRYSDLENSTHCIVHRVVELDMTEWLSLSFTLIYVFTYSPLK